ncbi:hypothetical protein SCALM49S_05182 [Streptomyces californicus]
MQLVSEVARESTLQRALKPLMADYDYIVIDCQPSLGLLTVNALTAAHKVIVPLECEFFALRGVALLTETIEKVQERLNPELELDGILATMYDSRTVHSREVLARVVEAFDEHVYHTVIGRTVRFPQTHGRRRAHHHVRLQLGRRGRLSTARQGGCSPGVTPSESARGRRTVPYHRRRDGPPAVLPRERRRKANGEPRVPAPAGESDPSGPAPQPGREEHGAAGADGADARGRGGEGERPAAAGAASDQRAAAAPAEQAAAVQPQRRRGARAPTAAPAAGNATTRRSRSTSPPRS